MMDMDEMKHSVRGNRAYTSLWYPGTPDGIDEVEVELYHVRAADAILISYDFERDGYVIKQASKWEWDQDEEPDSDWQEVAFIRAWQRESPSSE